MILQHLSRLVLLSVLTAAPWMFGGATTRGQVWIYAGVVLAVAMWLLSLLFSRPSMERTPRSSSWTPPALLVCASLIPLYAACQLIPVPWSQFSLSHAVLADWLDGRLPWRTGSAPISLAPADTMLELIHIFFAFCVLAMASSVFCERRGRMLLYGVIAVNGTALAIFGIVQKMTWNGMLYWNVPLRLGGQPFASYVNRNSAAGYLLMALACAFGLLLVWYQELLRRKRSARGGSKDSPEGAVQSSPDPSPHRRHRSRRGSSEHRPRIKRSRPRNSRSRRSDRSEREQLQWRIGIVLTLIAAMTIGVIASASRGGILALVAMTVTSLALFGRSRYVRLVVPAAAGIVLVAFGVLVWTGLDRDVTRRLQTLRHLDQFTDARPLHWQDTLQAVPDFPWFGTGLGTYQYAHRPYQQHVFPGWFYNADSEYVEWLLEGGAVGFGLMGLFVICAGATAYRLLHRRYGPPIVDAGAVLTTMLIGQLLLAITDFGISLAANQLLAAAILGSAAGRAAERRRRTSAEEETGTAASATDDNPRDPILISTAVFLMVGAAFGWHRFQTGYSLERFRDRMPSLKEPSRAQLLKTEVLLTEAPELMRAVPDDGKLQLALGRAHLYRLRMRLFELHGGPVASDDEAAKLWRQTSPVSLLIALSLVRRERSQTQLDDLLADRKAHDSLRLSVFHLRRAKQAEPLLPDVDLLLACLWEQAQRSGDNLSAHLRREAIISPVNADRLSDLGLIAQSVEEDDTAVRAWRRALTVDSEHARAIILAAIATLGESRTMDEVIPSDDPETLLTFAEVAIGERDRALTLAESLVSGDTGAAWFLRGRMSELNGDFEQAVEQFEQAVKREPFELPWRMKLASVYEEGGQWDNAAEQLEFCANMNSRSEVYRQRLDQLRERQRESQIRR